LFRAHPFFCERVKLEEEEDEKKKKRRQKQRRTENE
jgi:hypothetical protein